MSLMGIDGAYLRSVACAGAMILPLAVGVAATPASAARLVVRDDHVVALDKIDLPTAGRADFYAQVTVGRRTVKSKFVRNADDVRPNWVMVVPVRREKVSVKLEILDRNVLRKATQVDINRLPNKRDLDFEVDTRRCVITGFAETYKCGATIRRAGDERRRAEITFTVDVRP